VVVVAVDLKAVLVEQVELVAVVQLLALEAQVVMQLLTQVVAVLVQQEPLQVALLQGVTEPLV
jgi:hypothetical protein